MAAHEVVDRVVSLDRLARVTPEAVEHVVLHEPALDIPVVDVGDLQLPAARRLQARKYIPDGLVIEVRTGDGELARRILWLLNDQLDAAAAVELRHAKVLQVLAIG